MAMEIVVVHQTVAYREGNKYNISTDNIAIVIKMCDNVHYFLCIST